MANDQLFRWFFIGIFIGTLSISGYFRRRARRSGEAIPRAREGKPVLLSRLLFAAALYLPLLAYLLNPAWMAWSVISLPTWLRWLGAAVGLAMLPVLYWVFQSIANNISETFLTKEKHVLVTHGPYRRVRHPLYSVVTISLVSLSMLAANWFMFALACAAFLGIAGLVIPREESELIEKFGDAYQAYMERTSRFVPRLRLFR
ncbi:MAG: isoprenylcysteine carboxylmethyltransferase family protein [Candidatus Latescibacteria bacterium]|nr:isoprenylcysteine carboxylmethyltransferase family protein [Candidatus Latescibacterota bacterium]